MIRAVIFDLYNTLVGGGGARRDAVNVEMAGHLGVDPVEFDALFKKTADERMRGEFGSIEETLTTLATRLGGQPSQSQIKLATLAWQRFHRAIIWPKPDTLTTLDTLRERGLKLGLVTNCSDETVLQWPAQPMASRIHAMAFSSELGVLKPEPAIYHTICAQLEVQPSECVFVGDGADSELRGAAAMGMRVIRTLEFALNDPTWRGENIGKLRDLIDLLARNPTHEPDAQATLPVQPGPLSDRPASA